MGAEGSVESLPAPWSPRRDGRPQTPSMAAAPPAPRTARSAPTVPLLCARALGTQGTPPRLPSGPAPGGGGAGAEGRPVVPGLTVASTSCPASTRPLWLCLPRCYGVWLAPPKVTSRESSPRALIVNASRTVTCFRPPGHGAGEGQALPGAGDVGHDDSSVPTAGVGSPGDLGEARGPGGRGLWRPLGAERGPSVAASERTGPRSCKDEGKVPACPATPPGAPSRGPGKAAWTSH